MEKNAEMILIDLLSVGHRVLSDLVDNYYRGDDVINFFPRKFIVFFSEFDFQCTSFIFLRVYFFLLKNNEIINRLF